MRGNRPGGRNRDEQAQLITIYWRDIPAQVTARAGRRKSSVQLADRFQIAIDRAAVVAGKHTTDDYLGEWRRETAACADELSETAAAAAAALEEAYPAERLRRLASNGGREDREGARA